MASDKQIIALPSDLPKLPSGWEWKPLSEYVTSGRGISYGIVQPGDHTPSGIPILRSENVQNSRVELVDVMRVSPSIEEKYKRTRLSGGEVLITLVGAYFGKVAVAPKSAAGYNTARAVGVVPVNSDGLYLSQALQSPVCQRYIQAWATTTAQPTLNLGDVARIPIPSPPSIVRQEIAKILGSLEDKLDLNRRMNATLEAMARALFQSWFVDFDPVLAKLDGRQPAGCDPTTAALFPATFQDSSLGNIPLGWKTSMIGSKLQTVLGGTPSRANTQFWTDGTIPWINSGKTNEFRIIEPSEWITKEALENSSTKLLPRRTTVLAITGATLGQVSIAEIECCTNQSVIAIPASKDFPTEFIYLWVDMNIDKLIASQTGGAQQHINKGNVEELTLLCPEQRVVDAYQVIVKPIFDQIAANCFQSRTLATLRDTLLPKLLSGELSVKSFEKELSL